MKVTYPQLQKVLKSTTNAHLLRSTLKHIFSFKENLDIFSYYFFPHACTARIPDFHREIYEWLFIPEDGALAAPRGHAKSTLVGLIFISFCIVNKLEKYIVYMSQSYSKTVQFIEPLMNEFKENKRLKFVYGDMTPKHELDDRGKFREDIIDVNGIRIQAASFEKNIRGFKYKNQRPTLIIPDDIEDDERVLNPELRMKDLNKMNKVIIPSLDPICGKIKFIGTILHWDSLLIKKIRLYNGTIYKACNEDFTNILWPEYMTEDFLRRKKKSIGSVAFASEYLNNPIESEHSLINRVWIESCYDETFSFFESHVKYDFKIQGVDFAFSDRATADKSAFVGIGKTGDCYDLIQCITKRGMTVTEQFDYIQYLSGTVRYDDNALEENSIRSMSNTLNTYNFPFTLFWSGAADTQKKRLMSVSDLEFEGKRHTVGIKAMIQRVGTRIENNYNSVKTGEGRTFRIPYKTERDKEIAHDITSELCTYALQDGRVVEVGVHGDIPIALGYALERAEMEVFKFEGGML